MIRWAMLFLGGLTMVAAWSLWLLPEPATAEDLYVRPDQAAALLALSLKPDQVHWIDGRVDRANPLYRSGLPAPAFAAYRPGDTQPLFVDGRLDLDRLDGLLGSSVEASGPLDARAVVVDWTDDPAAAPHAASPQRRVIAPIKGSEATVFVVSPALASKDSAEAKAWFRAPKFHGDLSLFSDLPTNTGRLHHEMESIRQRFDEMGVFVPANAVVILPADAVVVRPAARRIASYFLPIEGSGFTLFVEALEGQGHLIPDAGPLAGVMRPAADAGLIGYEHIVSARVGNRAAVLELRDAPLPEPAESSPLFAGFSALAAIGCGIWLIQARNRIDRWSAAPLPVTSQPIAVAESPEAYVAHAHTDWRSPAASATRPL